jgi:hypothetical protein
MGGRTLLELQGSPMARPTSCTSGADAEAATTKSARKAVAKSLLNIVSVGGKNVGWEESAEAFLTVEGYGSAWQLPR